MRFLTIFILLFLVFTINLYADVKFTEGKITEIERKAAENFFKHLQEKLKKSDWIAIRNMIYTDDVKENSGYAQTIDDVKKIIRNNQSIISESLIYEVKVLNFSMFDDRNDYAVGPNELNRKLKDRKGKYIVLYLKHNGKRNSNVRISGVNTSRPYIELRLIPVNVSSTKTVYKIFELRIIKDGTIMIETDKC